MTQVKDIPCPENAYVSTWCAYNQYIFYSIDYIDFMANQTGEAEEKEKTEEHNTRIVRYDTLDKSIEDIYIADGVIEVSNLNYNGEILIWEEYPGKEEMTWQLKYVDISKVSEGVKVLLSDGDIEGKLWNVTPKLTEDSMYIYEQLDTEKNEHPIILYKYDLKTKKYQSLLDNEEYSYVYISTHGDGYAYTKIGTLEDGSVRIAKIEVVSE